ncbi:hypothetical protein CPEBRM1_ABPJDJAI_00796 [Companilactobacillus paralimentarius]|uniref:SpaA isopeptide-forming pilin-related protein n=1 Tax=Companilactobacillus paralimentarius TaxID=83526 RepID=UPI00384BC375
MKLKLLRVISEDSYSAVLQKFDRDDLTVGVPGAEYTLYGDDGIALETAVTNELGVIKIDNLKPGKYYFLETKAPEGYDLNPDKIPFTITENSNETGVGTLETSDPKTVTTEPGDNNNGNEGNTSEPGDNNGNEGNTQEPGDSNNGNEGNTSKPDENDKDDNDNGLIVDPEHPNTDNGNTDEGGLITNPLNPDTSNNGNSSTSESNTDKLPQTGAESGLLASLLGFVLLIGIAYLNRRHA